MKKLFLITLTTLIASALFMSCSSENDDDDYIVDWNPVNLFLQVRDHNGNDLLDPANPRNIIDGTTITFQGKTYVVSREWYDHQIPFLRPETRLYFARLYGLYLYDRDWTRQKTDYLLYFGEIDGAKDMDEDIIVTWPDKTTDVIHYHCSDHVYGKNPSCSRIFTLNGHPNDTGVFVITK